MTAEEIELKRVGAGTPIVLIHGIQCSSAIWAPVVDGLVAGGHEVVIPSLAGHRGGPQVPEDLPVSLAALVDDLEARLLETGIERAHLVGNSLGGWIALELATRGRALSVLALSPAGGWGNDKDLVRIVKLLSRGRGTLIRNRRMILKMLARPRARKMAMRLAMEHGDQMPLDALDAFIADMAACTIFDPFVAWVRNQPVLAPGAFDLDCPAVIAWGECDRTLPAARYTATLLAAAPSAEFVTLAGVGHIPMYDNPELIVQRCLALAASVDSKETTLDVR